MFAASNLNENDSDRRREALLQQAARVAFVHSLPCRHPLADTLGSAVCFRNVCGAARSSAEASLGPPRVENSGRSYVRVEWLTLVVSLSTVSG